MRPPTYIVYDACILSMSTKVLSEEAAEKDTAKVEGTDNAWTVSKSADGSSGPAISSTDPESMDNHIPRSYALEHESNSHSEMIREVPCIHVLTRDTDTICESGPFHSNAWPDKDKTDLTPKNTSLNVSKHILWGGST